MDKSLRLLLYHGDIIVPDIKPDILSTINTNGVVFVYKKEVLEGKIRLDGSINIYAMYLPDTERGCVRSLSSTLDFTQILDFEGAKPGMSLCENICIKDINCEILNGRKVSVNVDLDIATRLYSNEKVDVIKEVNELDNVQALNSNMKMQSLVGEGTSKVYAKETLMVDSADDFAEILNIDFRILNKDTRVSYNKVLVKADVEIKILYLTEDERINLLESGIPAMGFIEIPNISDDNLCDMAYSLKNLIIKPNSVEEHSIYVEAEIEATCRAYQDKEVNIIQDLYSPDEELEFTIKDIQVMTGKQKINDVCTIREKQTIPEIGSNRIYDVRVRPVLTNQKTLNDKIIFEGEILLDYMYSTDTPTGVENVGIRTPFTHTVEIPGINAKSTLSINIDVITQDFVIISDGYVDIKIDLNFELEISKSERLNIIDEITIEESRTIDNYSMVIYFTKPGDTLWNIAKRFKSTIQDIARVNDIEDIDKLGVGEQLFIPRYINRKVVV